LAAHHDRDLQAESSAEPEHAVSKLLPLLVRYELMPVALLERGEGPDGGAPALGVEDAHGQDVFTGPLWVVGVVGAAARLGGIVHTVGSLAAAARDQVDIWGYALYVSTVVAVEIEGAGLASGWVRGLGGRLALAAHGV
jgi:hypothetical protein